MQSRLPGAQSEAAFGVTWKHGGLEVSIKASQVRTIQTWIAGGRQTQHRLQYGMQEREFDVIVYGATGFTGCQAVRYLQRNAPSELRWAVSGRNRDKLQKLGAGVPVIAANSTDMQEARALVSRSNVILSTAGPFEVEACVDGCTHYVDITGEVAWVRSLIGRFHARAEENGTRIVPFCGFDSVPSDLGVYLLTKKLGADLCEAKAYFQVGGGRPNGGTIASAHRTYDTAAHKTGEDLFALSSRPNRALLPIEFDPTRSHFDRDVRAWTSPFPMSIIDSRVVRRSCALREMSVVYQEFMIFPGRFGAIWANMAAAGNRVFYAALRSRFIRDLLRYWLRPGSGPSEQAMNEGFFRCRVWGRTRSGTTGEISMSASGDPANRITVLCVCESALAIACDSKHLPDGGGVLTPSTGIGDALIEHLRRSGFQIKD